MNKRNEIRFKIDPSQKRSLFFKAFAFALKTIGILTIPVGLIMYLQLRQVDGYMLTIILLTSMFFFFFLTIGVMTFMRYALTSGSTIIVSSNTIRQELGFATKYIPWEQLAVIEGKKGDLFLKDKSVGGFARWFMRGKYDVYAYTEYKDFAELKAIIQGGPEAVLNRLVDESMLDEAGR